MAALANFASMAGQSGFGAADMYQSWGLNAKSASMSWDRWKNSQTRGPTYAMQGLRKAGLNPILAAGRGFSGTARPGAPQAPAVGRSPGVSPIAGSQIKLMEEQRRLVGQQTATAAALESKYRSETGKVDVDTQIARLSIPQKQAVADFFRTPDGQRIARLISQGPIVSKSWPELLSRLATGVATDGSLRDELFKLLKSAPQFIRKTILGVVPGLAAKPGPRKWSFGLPEDFEYPPPSWSQR